MTSPITIDGLDDRFAIVGTSGAGKTYAAKGLVEMVVRMGARLCVVDPLGVWWGLRAGKDGSVTGGLPVLILGGRHADVAITEHMGAQAGRLVGGSHIQCVIDLSGLESNAARYRFMSAFLDQIFEANDQPLHLVFDEADMWAPQRPNPNQTTLQGRMGEIVRRGRTGGFVPWLITQRPAVLDKDVLSMADTLVAFRLTLEHDRRAIAGQLAGQGDKAARLRMLAELPSLPDGEACIWSPKRGIMQRTRFPSITTYDSSRTPKRGERRAGAALAPIDAAAIAAALKVVPTAPTAASTPASGKALAAAREEGRQAGLAQGEAERAHLLAECLALQGALKSIAQIAGGEATAQAPGGVERPSGAPGAPILNLSARRQTLAAQAPKPPAKPARSPQAAPADGGALSLHPAARAILSVLRNVVEGLTWQQVAVRAGLSARGGHWESGRRQLRDRGLVVEKDHLVWASTAGKAASGGLRPAAASAEELLTLWCGKLRSPAPEMLRALAAASGPTTWRALADQLGKKPLGGHWETGRRALRDSGLVVEVSGDVVAVNELREAGRG